MTDGINIPREVADAEGVPDDLDANVLGEYRFPDPMRRRLAGWIYFGAAVLMVPLAIGLPMMWPVVALAVIVGVWHLGAAWPLGIEQEEALQRAAAMAPFAVGQTSAAITFHGARSKPRWSVILYSADEPPSQRSLVQLDAVTGDPVDDIYTEDVAR